MRQFLTTTFSVQTAIHQAKLRKINVHQPSTLHLFSKVTTSRHTIVTQRLEKRCQSARLQTVIVRRRLVDMKRLIHHTALFCFVQHSIGKISTYHCSTSLKSTVQRKCTLYHNLDRAPFNPERSPVAYPIVGDTSRWKFSVFVSRLLLLYRKLR